MTQTPLQTVRTETARRMLAKLAETRRADRMRVIRTDGPAVIVVEVHGQ